MVDEGKNDSPITAGVKYDEDKLRFDLISPVALQGLARILTFGANKYGARNWEKGLAWGRVYGALQRHLNSWWNGEDNDLETGENHLDHAAACLMFLQEYINTHRELDDRPRRVKEEGNNVSHAVRGW